MMASNNARHIRWNWENSPDNEDMVRYHFVVVGDKDREGILNKILEQLVKFSSLISVRKQEGHVKNTRFRYLFTSYDTNVNPDEIDFSRVSMPVKRDGQLRERKRGSIENYVTNIYE